MVKTIERILSILLILFIFVFLIRSLILNWSQIPFNSLHFSLLLLLLSYFTLLIHFVIYARSWQKIMQTLGSYIFFAQSFWMIATTQIAKYLPGGIWYTIGRVYVGKKEKMSSRGLTVSMILETCLILISSSVIFLLTTIATGNYNIINFSIYLILLIFAIIFLNPPVLSWSINLLLRLFKKPEIKLTITYPQIFKLSIYFFGLWIAQIIGFYFLINSIYPIAISKIFNLAAAYTLSWMTGFIVIFAPGGLGVREGMMSLLLSSFIPAPLAIAISFLSRVWITVFEIVIFFVGLIIRKLTSGKA